MDPATYANLTQEARQFRGSAGDYFGEGGGGGGGGGPTMRYSMSENSGMSMVKRLGISGVVGALSGVIGYYAVFKGEEDNGDQEYDKGLLYSAMVTLVVAVALFYILPKFMT